jgi:hypothetical protein
MATPRPHEFKLFFASKDIEEDGDPLPPRAVTGTGDAKTFTTSGLTQAAGYWNGAIGWFAANTATTALRGKFFQVRTHAAGGVLTLAKNLPAAPAVNDSFVLACGGGRRSGTEAFGMTVAGNLPELFPYAPAQIPGVTVVKVSPSLGEGTLTLSYANASKELFLKVGSAANGPGVPLTADATDVPVYDENERGFILVNVVFASLPTADRTQTAALAFPQGTFIPDIEGYETGSGSFPKYRYHPLVLMNTNEEDAMVGLAGYADRYNTASGSLTGTAMGTAAGRCTLSSGEANWPTNSYWVRNNTRTAARYVKFRSGKELSCAEGSTGYRGLNSGQTWNSGDSVEVMSDIDLGVEYSNASTGAFANPANVYTAPSGVTFAAADTEARAVQLDDLQPGGIVVLWIRETIVQDHRSRNDINGNLRFAWS